MNMNKCVKIMKTDVNFFQKDFTQGGSNIFETTMLRVQTNVQATVFNIFCGRGVSTNVWDRNFQESNIFWGNLFRLVNKKNNIWMWGGHFFLVGDAKMWTKFVSNFCSPFWLKFENTYLFEGLVIFSGKRGVPYPSFSWQKSVCYG